MSPMHDADNRRRLEPEQIIDAKQALGCGAAVPAVARYFNLSSDELRQQLGMPVWKDSPAAVLPWTTDQQRTLADSEVSR